MKTTPKFFVMIPVKPYVRQFIDVNYGTPANLVDDPAVHTFFKKLLKKPSVRFDTKYPAPLCTYKEEVEVIISEDDFYKYQK